MGSEMCIRDRHVEVEVIDLRTLRPIDQDTVISSVMKTGKALIVHEDTLALGIGAEISAICPSMFLTH